MREDLHKNYRTASNLIGLTLVLDIVELLYGYSTLVSTGQLLFAIIWFVFMILTTYVVRRGVNWMKYTMMIINVLLLLSIIISIKNPLVPLFNLVIMCVDFLLFIAATIFLFKIPLQSDHQSLDSDI